MISPYKLIDNCLAKSIGIMVRWFGFANGSRAHRLQQTLIAKKAKCAYQGYPGPRMMGLCGHFCANEEPFAAPVSSAVQKLPP